MKYYDWESNIYCQLKVYKRKRKTNEYIPSVIDLLTIIKDFKMSPCPSKQMITTEYKKLMF